MKIFKPKKPSFEEPDEHDDNGEFNLNGGLAKIFGMFQFALMALVAAVVALGSFYTVSEQEQAVITQFGKVVAIEEAGLHFKVPFVQNVRLVPMTTQGLAFGYNPDSSTSVENESFMITKDFNFVNVDFYVEWKVTNPSKFLYNANDPEGLLQNILQSEARSVVSSYDVDEVLTTAKVEIQTKIKEGALEKLDEYDIGLVVSNVSMQDATPPTDEVVDAFKNVENAKQSKDTEINKAYTYYNEVIPKARGDADKILKESEAAKEARINEANGQVARFNEMFTEYTRSKDITKTRIYLETMELLLPDVKVIIESEGGSDTMKFINMDTPSAQQEAQQAAAASASVQEGQ